MFVICTDFKYMQWDYWRRCNGRENNQGGFDHVSSEMRCWGSQAIIHLANSAASRLF